MGLTLEFFIFYLPESLSYLSTLFCSAVLGLALFGVYDFTNRAVLKDYPLKIAFVDTGWGIFIYSLAGSLNYFVKLQVL